jgi:divalent metal cation (Fe/Co/Zn/Cd) transporter
MSDSEQKLYRQAYRLSLFTILYNVVEGVLSMVIGYEDETLSLFGFGADSFIEVISGIGIAMMILRIKHNPKSPKSKFEVTALKITGSAFYLLAVSLFASIIINIFNHHKPETTIWGVVISSVSIAVMIWLMNAKRNIGKKLHSDSIIADANCTKICIYMSLVLLVSSLIFELTGFIYTDAIGAAGLVYLSISEGKESLEKANGKGCDCIGHCEKA